MPARCACVARVFRKPGPVGRPACSPAVPNGARARCLHPLASQNGVPAFFKKFKNQIKMTVEEASYLAVNGMPVRALITGIT